MFGIRGGKSMVTNNSFQCCNTKGARIGSETKIAESENRIDNSIGKDSQIGQGDISDSSTEIEEEMKEAVVEENVLPPELARKIATLEKKTKDQAATLRKIAKKKLEREQERTTKSRVSY